MLFTPFLQEMHLMILRWVRERVIPKILDALAEKSMCEELSGDKRIQLTQEQY